MKHLPYQARETCSQMIDITADWNDIILQVSGKDHDICNLQLFSWKSLVFSKTMPIFALNYCFCFIIIFCIVALAGPVSFSRASFLLGKESPGLFNVFAHILPFLFNELNKITQADQIRHLKLLTYLRYVANPREKAVCPHPAEQQRLRLFSIACSNIRAVFTEQIGQR